MTFTKARRINHEQARILQMGRSDRRCCDSSVWDCLGLVMKMSDVFNLPVKFECADLFTIGSGFMIDTDETTNKQAELASLAVNNHDKLTEELQAKTDFLNVKVAECDNLTERVKELEELLSLVADHEIRMREVYPESYMGRDGENLERAIALLEKE